MTEKSSSGSRKRTVRARKPKGPDELDEQRTLPDEPEPAPIQDALDEVAAMRSRRPRTETPPDADAEFDAPPPRPRRRTAARVDPATFSSTPEFHAGDEGTTNTTPASETNRPISASLTSSSSEGETSQDAESVGEFRSARPRRDDRGRDDRGRDDRGRDDRGQAGRSRGPRSAHRTGSHNRSGAEQRPAAEADDGFGANLLDDDRLPTLYPVTPQATGAAQGDDERRPGSRNSSERPRHERTQEHSSVSDSDRGDDHRSLSNESYLRQGASSDEVEMNSDGGSDAGGEGGADNRPQDGDYTDESGRRRRRRRRRGRGPNDVGPGGGHSAGGYSGGPHNGYAGGPQNGGPSGDGQPGQQRSHSSQPRHSQGRPQRGRQPGGGGNFQGQRRGPGPQGGQPRRDQNRERQYQQPQGPRGPEILTPVQGVMEIHPKGYGFLREVQHGYSAQETDAFISSTLMEKYKLRAGVHLTGEAITGVRGQGPRLKTIETIEGRLPDQYAEIRDFDSLTAINPFEQIKLETGPSPITMRVMDLLTPIGKGQRALIVAPPRSGKTMLLQEIANAVTTNHPEICLMVLLIDERPEEVTEMRRHVKGEVIASSLDREVESHIRVSQLIFERAKRMAESGRDVFVLLDSITRTARAFNKWSNSGRTGTGGLDIRAMDIPKKMFGTARRFEEGGSLTVVGTALIDTGGRMDDAIFQEFKGTGNMELVLSRDLADRRVWPAIDVSKSGTRREEKILSPEVLDGVTLLRRSLISMNPVEAMSQLVKTLAKYPSNADFLAKIRSVM